MKKQDDNICVFCHKPIEKTKYAVPRLKGWACEKDFLDESNQCFEEKEEENLTKQAKGGKYFF